MPAYDERLFAPPAPVLSAHLRNPLNGATIPDVLLLIDTGADVTLLPFGAVNAAGIEQTGASYELLAFDGRSASAVAVRAELLMLGRIFRGQYLVIDQEVGSSAATFSTLFLSCWMDHTRHGASTEAIEPHRADTGSPNRSRKTIRLRSSRRCRIGAPPH
jgi:hypothetical protein